MAKTLRARIITKHDTEKNWNEEKDFQPECGEIIIYEEDSKNNVSRIKIGDGNKTINQLGFITDPFVEKVEGMGLSTKDYTEIDKQKVDKIPIDWTYQNYIYEPGYDLGLNNFTFYNKGIVNIEAAEDGFLFYKRTGPNESDVIEDTIHFNTTSTDEITNSIILKLPEYIKTGSTDGTISVNGTEVEIKGWKDLANSIGSGNGGSGNSIEEILISQNLDEGGQNLTPNIKLWYSILEEQLFYRKEDSGFFPILPDNYIIDVSEGVEKGTITVTKNSGSSTDIPVGTDITFTSGADSTTGAYFEIEQNNESQTIYTNGLSLSGGTVTGITSFANTNDATSTATGAVRISGGLGVAKSIYGNQVHGAVWNDYAEYRQSEEPIEPGYIVYSGDDGILHKTVGRLQFFEGVVSDTFGFSIGKTDKAQTPLAVAGRVLVYTDEELHAGNVVCAGPHGKACKMTKQEIKDHPDRIVGIVSEVPSYEIWGEENIPVNGRVWIRVK